jgi:hypothetical protein
LCKSKVYLDCHQPFCIDLAILSTSLAHPLRDTKIHS